MQGRDCGLENVGAPPAERERAIERRSPLRNLIEVPQRSILIPKEDQRAVGEPGVPPSIVDQHQRQQAVYLGLVGHQLGERAPKPDRLSRELSAATVTRVEDQVHDCQHRGKPVRKQMRRRDAERDPGGLDLALRADEPLRHGRLGNQEGAGDLIRPETAKRSQRERDLGLQRERRVAAGEDELQPLVRDRDLVHAVLHQAFTHVEQTDLRREGAIAADAVDRAVARRDHEPGARIFGPSLARPALGSDRERLLGGFLGEVEVVEEADQAGEDAPPLIAEDLLDDRYRSTIGRTSTAPPMRAAGIRDASSIAASRSSASKKR